MNQSSTHLGTRQEVANFYARSDKLWDLQNKQPRQVTNKHLVVLYSFLYFLAAQHVQSKVNSLDQSLSMVSLLILNYLIPYGIRKTTRG